MNENIVGGAIHFSSNHSTQACIAGPSTFASNLLPAAEKPEAP